MPSSPPPVLSRFRHRLEVSEHARLDYAGSRVSRLDIALAHAERGRRVFPFRLRKHEDGQGFDKIPLVKWKDRATDDVDQIRAWSRKFPTAHWGWCLPEGYLVADIDDQEAFDETGLNLPAAPSQETPSGGLHFLYSGVGARQTVKQVPGLDTRVGGKGWVGLYSTDSFVEGEVQDAPDWLLMERPAGEEWHGPTEDDPITSRQGILELVGRYAGLPADVILSALLRMQEQGAIADSDPTRPWTKDDFRQIADEFSRKPQPVAPPEEVRVRMVRREEKPTSIESVSAASLLGLDLPELEWAVYGILPEGSTLIVSPPKIGKSALVLQMALAMVSGGQVLGQLAPRKRPVLYLALEDGERRMKDRIQANLRKTRLEAEDLARLEILFDAPKLGKGLEGALAGFYEANPHGAVFIDTLQHVRPEHKQGKGAYQIDVDDFRILRDLVRHRPGAVLGIVHHTNKPNSKDDFITSVSGTHGLAGTSDTILRVTRKRHEDEGTLEVSGRDVSEQELPVIYEDLLWRFNPFGKKTADKAPRQAAIYDWLVENEAGSPTEIAEGIDRSAANVSEALKQMLDSGKVVKDRHGVYRLVDAPPSLPKVRRVSTP